MSATAIDSGGPPVSVAAAEPTSSLAEQAAVQQYGQSVYAAPGHLSPPQRKAHTRDLLDLLTRIAFAAGRAEGYAQGHKDGRLDAYRYVGIKHLATAIGRDLQRIQREVES